MKLACELARKQNQIETRQRTTSHRKL